MSDILLDIKNLNIVYSTTDGVVRALNDANLQIRRGEALGLVGETGAGKTTLARGIMRLIPHPPGEIVSGEIIYEGHYKLRHDRIRPADARLRLPLRLRRQDHRPPRG